MHRSGSDRGVGSAVVVRRCKKWIAESVVPDVFSRVDWDSEIDPCLSFNENVSLLLTRFPEAFRSEAVDAYYNRVKQIVFIAPLIEKILRGEVQCTYRTTPKHGFLLWYSQLLREGASKRTPVRHRGVQD